jgi:hypothetical protein
VPIVAGTTSLIILLKTLSAATRLVSPASPMRAILRLLIEHTNPDNRKNRATQKLPPVITILKNGKWNQNRSLPGLELYSGANPTRK